MVLVTGWLNKKKSNNMIPFLSEWNRRYFTFDGTELCYYDTDRIEMTFPKDVIKIENIKGVELLRTEPFGSTFILVTSDRVYTLSANDEIDCKKWIKSFEKAINRYTNSIMI